MKSKSKIPEIPVLQKLSEIPESKQMPNENVEQMDIPPVPPPAPIPKFLKRKRSNDDEDDVADWKSQFSKRLRKEDEGYKFPSDWENLEVTIPAFSKDSTKTKSPWESLEDSSNYPLPADNDNDL